MLRAISGPVAVRLALDFNSSAAKCHCARHPERSEGSPPKRGFCLSTVLRFRAVHSGRPLLSYAVRAVLARERIRRDGLLGEALAIPIHGAGCRRAVAGMHFL